LTALLWHVRASALRPPFEAKSVGGCELPTNKRSWARGGRIALAVACVAASPGQATAHDLDRKIEGTYLYKFAHFVTWPAAAFSGPAAALKICIQGVDPFGAQLEQTLADQRVGSHPVEVMRLPRLDPEAGCHVAYVAGGPAQSAAQALQAIEGSPVLTVTDDARETADRGIVDLRVERGRVRFSIDMARAERNGVEISSKLLALAVVVKR